MSIDPRRSGLTLWVLWVVAAALGAGLATVLALVWLAALVNGSELSYLSYIGELAAIAALFQSLLLVYVAPRKKAAALWLPATVIGMCLVAPLIWDVINVIPPSLSMSFPPATYAALHAGTYMESFGVALGLSQGLVLLFVTARKAAPVIWIAANLIALPVMGLFGGLYGGPPGGDPSLIALSSSSNAVGAAVTGLALVLILRLGRRDRATGPGLAARSLPAPTP